nr:ABC transporter substrate-binding protein [Quadrisphaera sp. INWT6]
MRRRALVSPVLISAAAVLLAGCSSGSAEPGASSSAPASSGASSAAAGAFPATVDTKFGEVTVESAPQRVVALGWGDAETALALGVQPVGASDWLGFGGEGVGPWAQGLYTTPPTIIETLEPSYEAIAALQPDLILDTKSSGDQARYERLSQIAPTIGVPEGGDSYLTTTEQQMDLVSEALGKEEEGDQLVDALEKEFEDAAAAHPQWDGRTATVAAKNLQRLGRLHRARRGRRAGRARRLHGGARLRAEPAGRRAAGEQRRLQRRHLHRAARPARRRRRRRLPDLHPHHRGDG